MCIKQGEPVRLYPRGGAFPIIPVAAPTIPEDWRTIDTAPMDKSVLLYCKEFVPLYCGRKRYGNLGEPQQDVFAWRCDSSGRFANPTHWMPLPAAPKPESVPKNGD